MIFNQLQNLLFLSYIDDYYDNIFLSRLIKKLKKGVSQRTQQHIKEKLKVLPKIENVEVVLFYYILFARTRKKSLLNQLGWSLLDEIDLKNMNKDQNTEKNIKNFKDICDHLGLPKPTFDSTTVKNAIYYTKGI